MCICPYSTPHRAQVLHVGRVNVYNSTVTRVDQMDIQSLDRFINSKEECIKPVQCLAFMHTVLSRMHDLLPGSYVLDHAAGDATVRILRECEPAYASYDLHEAFDAAGQMDKRVSGPVPALSTWSTLLHFFCVAERGGGVWRDVGCHRFIPLLHAVAVCHCSVPSVPPPAPPELSRNVLRPACGSVGPCSI